MSLPVKLGVGALTLGSAVGAGYAGVNYFSKEDKKEELNNTGKPTKAVRDLIKNKFEYILLNTTAGNSNPDKDHWSAVWADYQRQNSSGTDVFKLKGWATRNGGDLTEELKKKCENLSGTLSNEDDENYLNVTKYCSRGVTIADVVTEKSLRTIEVNNTNDDATIWKTRIDNKNSLQEKLNILEIKDPVLDAPKLRKGCKDALSKKKQDTGYPSFFEAYQEVCLKKDNE